MSTEAQLKAISNSELASGNQIPAIKHRTVNNAIIEEMYDAQSRGDVLAGVQGALSLASGDQVLVIRSGQAFLLDATDFGFVDALADLTDVSIPTPANDQILAYNSSNSKWEAKDVNTLTSVVSISGTATVNALTKFTGTNSIGNSIISDNGTTVSIGGNLNVDNNLTVGTINSGTSSDFVKGDGSLDSTTYQDTSEKDQANGYAPLDSGAKIPLANLPDSILGQVSYQGTWVASTNTPTLDNPPASTTKGEYYVASDDGTQFGIEFKTGDWIISNGTAWEKVDNTDAVSSVFGRLGNVVANAGDYDSFYVNLDGNQTITGEKTFESETLRLEDAGNGLVTKIRNISVNTTIESGFANFGFNGTNDIFFSKGIGLGNAGVLAFSNTAARTYTLPDATGTIALTSDLDDTLDSVTDRGATTTNAITVGGATINGNLAVDTDTLFVDSSSGNVGIGTDSPSYPFTVGQAGTTSNSYIQIASTTTGTGNLFFGDATGSGVASFSGYIQYQHSADAMVFGTSNTERMCIDSSGNVGIGTSSPSVELDVVGNLTLSGLADSVLRLNSSTAYYYDIKAAGDDFQIIEAGNVRLTFDYSATKWIASADFDINGSLSKNSGSFKIDHPLPEKKDTHNLVHSFVEAPQADNIYRGKIELSEGKATVNLDEAGRMTEGTFVLLNGNIQCFTSNESGWTAIRGKVEGNILTIEAQDAECTDIISWLVIGERIDQHMIDTAWTDENGRVITEPLKKAEPTPEEEATIIDNGQ